MALGQGGPPLVTDDPDTPGDRRWEINLAAVGMHTSQGRQVTAPDADINFGWGEDLQLKLDMPWVNEQDGAQPWKSGLGAPSLGIKWRFVDIEDAGYSLSTYPQYSRSWLPSSVRRGLADPGEQLLLPLEAATVVGQFHLDMELGRQFLQDAPDQWVFGIAAAHPCGEDRECLGEVHGTYARGYSQTLVNLGLHWKLSDSLAILAAAGREVGPHTPDQKTLLYYLGVQLSR